MVGMAVRPIVREWVDAHKSWLNILSNGVILLIVYTAFCDSVEGRIWEHYGIGLTVKVLIGVIALFTSVSLFVWAVSSVARLERDDFIAALFCSIKKTLAMGVPLAQLINRSPWGATSAQNRKFWATWTARIGWYRIRRRLCTTECPYR